MVLHREEYFEKSLHLKVRDSTVYIHIHRFYILDESKKEAHIQVIKLELCKSYQFGTIRFIAVGSISLTSYL